MKKLHSKTKNSTNWKQCNKRCKIHDFHSKLMWKIETENDLVAIETENDFCNNWIRKMKLEKKSFDIVQRW